MTHKRILSLWFPRLGAERMLRRIGGAHGPPGPLAVVAQVSNAQVLHSISAQASEAGLHAGQPLRDALAMCPHLITCPHHGPDEAQFLGYLRRWAGKFSPWVGEVGTQGLALDITGCAHLFGGETGLLEQIEVGCARFQITLHAGLADTLGTAWALARYANQTPGASRSGDAIDQEAPATRARAVKRGNWARAVKPRNWKPGVPPPQVVPLGAAQRWIAAPGQARSALSPLPVAALRLPDDMVLQLNRLGLRRIQDLINQPRGPLARRFGAVLTQRLDQALGQIAEPISPAKPPLHFAARMTLPEPIGLEDDVMGVIERLLPGLTRKLAEKGRGARHIRLEAYKTDQTMQAVEVRLARPSTDPARIRPLLQMQVPQIQADFGIDLIRLIILGHEPVTATQHSTKFIRPQTAPTDAPTTGQNASLDDLIGKLGARIGLEAVTRLHPSSSHIPEKAAQVLAAAWSEPQMDWATNGKPRPMRLFEPELVNAPDAPHVPATFKWRGQIHETTWARGPERIAPEWWLEDRAWRTGTRDYWEVVTQKGARLWLYFAHGGTISGGWFCQGSFA